MRLESVLKARHNEVDSLSEAVKMRKSKYVKRWKGRDGKWKYEYGKELVSQKKPSKDKVQRNLEEGRGKKSTGEKKQETVETLPQDISTLTIDNVTSLVKQSVKMPLKTLRNNQDIVERQKGMAYKQKNAKAYRRLEVIENIYQAAVDIKEFKFTTAGAWAKEIVGKIKQYSDK